MIRVVLTGARGFVGRFVARALQTRGAAVVAAGRTTVDSTGGSMATAVLGPESTEDQMRAALEGAGTVVHLAAAVHDVRAQTTPAEYMHANCDFPLRLARAAASAAVPRFVFASTIKVNGESTAPGEAFDEASPGDPQGGYAESKWLAEQGLHELGASRAIRVRIVRPPLVYGPGVRANFYSLLRCVKAGVPLPFAGFENLRSFVYVENLADVFARLALEDGDPAPSRVYVVTDGEDVSTAELVRRMARALRKRPRLFYVPQSLFCRGLGLLNKEEMAARLLVSLCADGRRTRQEFAGFPRFTLDEGLSRTAEWLAAPS